MGRATITEDKGSGLYTVSVDYGTENVASMVARLNATIATTEDSITQLDADIAAAEADSAAAVVALNDAILALAASDPDDNAAQRTAVENTTRDELVARAIPGTIKAQRSVALALVASLTQRVEDLLALTLVETRDAWCCDFTEDATGLVATVEVNGEQPGLLIEPEAPAPDGTEGQVTHRLAMTPSATFLNAALLPGWQRHRPTYRVGEITALGPEDTCSVTLDAAVSSAQGLGINQSSALEAVPIQYMTCNAQAFEIGDRVVVRFDAQDWAQPKVIGFESNPRPCTLPIWVGANRRDLLNPGSVDYRLTAQINPATFAINDRWQLTMGWSNDIAQRGQSVYTLLGGNVRNATSGAVEFYV
ncbi:MAG TPA: hypothetical protein VIC02_05465, partial [Kineobactrum sp.]